MKNKYSVLILVVAVATGFGLFAHAQLAGVTLPSVPLGVVATIVPPSQVSISWAASTESSGTIGGYYVYRNNVQINATAGTSLVDSGIAQGTYTYTVAA